MTGRWGGMLDRKTLQTLGCWKGYQLERVEWPQGDGRTLSLYLRPMSKVIHCEQCGERCQQVHEKTVRRVRDLPLFEYRVVLHVPRRRVLCERCGGPRLEKLDWLGRYQRVTQRFADACEKLLRSSSVQTVAAFFDLCRRPRDIPQMWQGNFPHWMKWEHDVSSTDPTVRWGATCSLRGRYS